jgi:transcriptional regulator with XRE-family HTH domain
MVNDNCRCGWARLSYQDDHTRTNTRSPAARGLLNWTQAQLAKAAGLSQVAVKNLERGRTDPRASTLTAIQEAFDRAGVVFLDPGDTRNGGSGVRFK